MVQIKVVANPELRKKYAAELLRSGIVLDSGPGHLGLCHIKTKEEIKQVQQWPMSVVMVPRESLELVVQILPLSPQHKIVSNDVSTADLAKVIRQSHDELLNYEAKMQKLAEIKEQNKQLEALQFDLEREVTERTASLQVSKAQAEEKLTQLRDLLLYMKDLAMATGPEEVLMVLRRELKVIAKNVEPIIAFAQKSGDLRLVYFRGGVIREKRAQKMWPQSVRIRRNDKVDSQYLADEMGRPMNRILAIPLITKKMSSHENPPALFFEHQWTTTEVDLFLQKMTERLQGVSVALDRLLLEQDLRLATYMWENTFDSIEDPVAIIEYDYRLLRANKKFSAGRSATYCYEVFAQSTQPCHGCPLEETVKAHRSQSNLVKRHTSAYSVQSYPIEMTGERAVTTMVNHYLDVTDSLELKERMIQTEKMAALGHLAGHIAHELNNPLTGIRGIAQFWLANELPSPRVRQDLQEVESAALRSHRIINDLLSFAHKGPSAHETIIDLNELVGKTLPLLKTVLSEHVVDVVLPERPARVQAEMQTIQQVLFNLLKNACQAMTTRGEIRVEVSHKTWQGQPAWALEISDSGPGIPEHLLQQIFTPFFTTKAKGEGTGLGLSLSRNLMRRMNGELTVSSAVGQGTTFTVWLKDVDQV